MSLLALIDQIVIELHFSYLAPEEWGVLDILKSLSDEFVSVNYHFNNWSCFIGREKTIRRLKSKTVEVTLVNKRLIKINK